MARTRMYKRKRGVRRRTYRRRRIVRKRANMLVTKRHVQVEVANFTDSLQNIFNSYAFTLSSLPASGEFTNLFDQYKICGIKYRFYVDNHTQDSAFSSVTRNQTHYLRIWHVIDTNDNSLPANFDALQQYPNMRCEILTSDKPWTRWRYFKPKFADTVYTSLIQNGYAVRGGYLNTTSADVPHYGIKYILNDSQEFTKVYLQFWVYVTAKTVK